jgi:hypothetical protein
MSNNFPEILYKYRTWQSDYSKNILLKNEIYFSSSDQFNDPFDASLPYKYSDAELTPENIRKKLFEIGRRINPQMSKEELEIEVTTRQNSGIFTNGQYWKDFYPGFKIQMQNTFGIFCLTEKKDDILMWSHYSNSHQGFCIGFDSKIIFEATQCTLGPIRYENEFPTMPLFNYGPQDLLRLVMTKSKHWEYECEARMIKMLSPNKSFEVPNEAFKEIIFGCKINAKTKEELINLCRSKFNQIKFFDAKLNDSNFKLDIIPFE